NSEPQFNKKMKLQVCDKVGAIGVLKMTRRTTSPDTSPSEEHLTLLTITCRPSREHGAAVDGSDVAMVFQYSALSQTATVPVREQEANPYFVRRLPARMIKASQGEQEEFGKLWATYLIPEDFHRIIQCGRH